MKLTLAKLASFVKLVILRVTRRRANFTDVKVKGKSILMLITPNVKTIFTHCFSDEEDPIIFCPGNQTFETTPGRPTAVAVYNPIVSDNSGQYLNVSCSAVSGSDFDIGRTDVICQAYDPSGNQAVCNFTVEIKGGKLISFLICRTPSFIGFHKYEKQ